MKKLEAVLRTSEFWLFVAQVVVQAASAPVPDDVKAAGWVYIAARVVSKLVKFKPSAVAAAVVGLALIGGVSASARAQNLAVPITNVSQRFHVTANGGAMVITTAPNWSGASLGGTVLYNLHPSLSVFGGYDHGFAVRKTDAPLNLYRAVGSLRIHPNAFVGFGYAWFDKHTDGALAQLLVTKQVMHRLAIAGVYAHVMSRTATPDFEYVRVFANYHLFGKE